MFVVCLFLFSWKGLLTIKKSQYYFNYDYLRIDVYFKSYITLPIYGEKSAIQNFGTVLQQAV